jgi:hypothetical protein
MHTTVHSCSQVYSIHSAMISLTLPAIIVGADIVVQVLFITDIVVFLKQRRHLTLKRQKGCAQSLGVEEAGMTWMVAAQVLAQAQALA